MKGLVAFVTGATLVVAGAAGTEALVLDSATTKSAAKWRGDLTKQGNKLTDCIVKALLQCESKGASTGLECDTTCDTSSDTGGALNFDGTGACTVSTHPDAGANAAFRAAIDKCVGGYRPGKAAFDADGSGVVNDLGDQSAIGCQADCSQADGTQLDLATCTGGDISTAWAGAVTGPGGVTRSTLTAFDLQFGIACGADTPDLEDEQAACTSTNGKLLAKMVSGVNKALAKCENDFKNAGGGGPTDVGDGTTCHAEFAGVCPGTGGAGCAPTGGNQAVQDAVDAVFTDLVVNPVNSLNIAQALVPTVVEGLQGASSLAYNMQIGFDTGGSPSPVGDAAPSCGTCGDGNLDFGEECDYNGDDSACPGSCPSTTNFLAGQTPCACP